MRDFSDQSTRDSFSFSPVLLGKEEAVTGRDDIFILGSSRDTEIAVCTGKRKLIMRYGTTKKRGHSLYDLRSGLMEQNDFTDKRRKIVDRLVLRLA